MSDEEEVRFDPGGSTGVTMKTVCLGVVGGDGTLGFKMNGKRWAFVWRGMRICEFNWFGFRGDKKENQ